MRHAPGEQLPRHRHDQAFVTLVLAGGYVEAGDTGRHRVRAGDLIAHRRWEFHLDAVGKRGAEVLILPLHDPWAGPVRAVARDPDAVVRAAEGGVAAGLGRLVEDLLAPAPSADDWPDLLAAQLQRDPDLSLADWADDAGLHPGSLSRGFHQVFGVTPAAYRLGQRTHRALAELAHAPAGLAAIAAHCGFADQAHMTRAVRSMTGLTPLQCMQVRARVP